MQLTYEYRIYPTEAQKKEIFHICSCVRYVYNKALEERTNRYREEKRWTKIDREKILSPSFLRSVDQSALNWAISNLESAYRQFFWKKFNEKLEYREESLVKANGDSEYTLMDTDLKTYPRFKKKKETQISFTTSLSEFSVDKNRFSLPSLGRVKIKYHRSLPDDIRLMSITILKKKSGKYFACVRFELLKPIKRAELNIPIGVMFDIGKPVLRSDGKPVYYRHQTKEQTKRMDKAYRKLKRQVPGSKRYEKQREYLASLYEHRSNQRKDDLHKMARQITNDADSIYLQQPGVRRYLRSPIGPYQGKVILDEAWWIFSSYLKYKAQLEGKQCWEVPLEIPIHSTCSGCGYWTRERVGPVWHCPECKLTLDRKINAVKVLEAMGQKYIREYNMFLDKK